MRSQVLRSSLGKTYKIYIDGRPGVETSVGKTLSPVRFDDLVYARQFLRSLSAPPGLWRRLANMLEKPAHSGDAGNLESAIGRLLLSKRIQVYELPVGLTHYLPSPDMRIKGSKRSAFEFAPATALLLNTEAKPRKFQSKNEALHFIDELEPEVEQLKAISKNLKLPIGNSSSATYPEYVDALAENIHNGEAVILESNEENRTELKDEGGDSSGEAEAAPRKSHTLGPHVGATAAVVGPAVAEEKPVECGVCKVSSFDVSCKHGRAASMSGKLRVVPDPDRTRTRSVKLMGVEVKIKEEFGGKDEIDCSVSLAGAKRDDCAKIKTADGWETKSKSNLVIDGETGENLDLWPIDAAPQSYTVSGKGCSGAEGKVTVESFPSQRYSIEGKLDIFKGWVEGVNKAWEQWGEKFFSYSPVALTPKLTGPTGSFSASWGWKEDKDWKAYFDFAASFGLNPILGVELEIALSVVKLLGTVAGVPPVLSKLTAEHLIDVLFKAKAGCSAQLSGSPHGKKYPDDSFLVSGDAKFATEGKVEVEMEARAGSKYIVAVSLIANAKTSVKGEDVLDLNREGLFAQTTINIEPLTMTVKVKYRYMVVYTKTDEKKWTPWKAIELYKSENKKILPR